MNQLFFTIYLLNLGGFSADDILEYTTKIRDTVVALVSLLLKLPDVLLVLFPFLRSDQVDYYIFLLVAFVVISGCFFVKKVF